MNIFFPGNRGNQLKKILKRQAFTFRQDDHDAIAKAQGKIAAEDFGYGGIEPDQPVFRADILKTKTAKLARYQAFKAKGC